MISLLLIIVAAPACSRRADPQAAFDHALQAFRRGDIAIAAEEANRGYTQFHSLSPEWAWKFRLLQADSLAWRGMPDEVLKLLASEHTPVPPGELVIHKRRVEGSALASLRRFAEAQQKFDEAENLCSGQWSPDCADVLLERGVLEMTRGHYDSAEHVFQQALDVSRAHEYRFKEATARLDLSWAALEQEHYDQAIDWADSAYRISTEIGSQDVAQNALGNTGWAYYKLGEPERAEKIFIEAESRAAKLGDLTDQVKWLTTVGYIYLDAREYDRAEHFYRQALDLAKKTTKQDMLDALTSLALVSERTGKLDQARDYADQTIALVPKDGNRLDMLYPLLVKGRVAARQHDTAQAEKTFREIEQDPRSHVFLKWEAEHSLAQLYEDENKPDLADREYRAALSTFERARSSLQHEESSLPFPANAAGLYDDYLHFLVGRGKTAEALQVAEYYRGRTLAEGLGFLQRGTSSNPDRANAQAIARKVGGTILFYWLGEKQSYLWAATAQKLKLFPLPARSEIEPAAQRYRKALSEQQEFLQTADADGRALYRTLVAPAQEFLPKNAKVVIIPDGALNTLNFETLLTTDPNPHYWIEDVTITDASSLHLLAASRAGSKPGGKLLLLGDALAPNPDYPQLRKAAAEMQSIEKHFPAAEQQVFAREQATPPTYLTGKPEQFAYIHFVAHGTASRSSPLDSAIVLSRSSAQEDSFKLYARDIIHRPLHADLVTISTCYGAGARAYSGEGLVGLSWAFLRAGAHNVIGALWEVSDDSTPRLMDDLYGQLKKGSRPEAALRAAKISMLHSSSQFKKPFFWAPFQLYTGS